MVKQGPIPAFVHSLLEYVVGIGLIAAPLLLDYDSGAATAVSIVLGVLILFLAATTTSTMSLINQVPLSMHIVFDYVVVAVLIASPFLFSFSDESTPTALHIALGVVHLLVSIGTRYSKEETPERGTPKREQRAAKAGLPKQGGSRGGAAAAAPEDGAPAARPARDSKDALPDDSIPEFEPPPRRSSE